MSLTPNGAPLVTTIKLAPLLTLKTLPALLAWRARTRRRSIRPARTAARARTRPRPRTPARIFHSPGRPPSQCEIEDAAGYYSLAGASAETPAQPGYYVATAGANARRRSIRPARTAARARARPRTPARIFHSPGRPPSQWRSKTLRAITVWPAASAEAPRAARVLCRNPAGASAETIDPAGTYSPAGASAPIADPGGTYSAAAASAPTTDPAGTYRSPYALDRLFLIINNVAPTSSVLSFQSATAVANYFGATSEEALLANDYFADGAHRDNAHFALWFFRRQTPFVRSQH